MGMMQGKVVGNSIVIMDSFALPVQGTETRVNAGEEANAYMVEYVSASEMVRANLSVRKGPITHSSIGTLRRRTGKNTCWDGITRIPGTAAGCLESTSAHKRRISNSKIPLLLSWYVGAS